MNFLQHRKNRNLTKSTGCQLSQALSETSRSFCKKSSIHGYKNVIADIESIECSTNKSHKLTQSISLVIWIVVCVLCAILGFVLIRLIFERYHYQPTITTIETTNYRIWKVHFPAVTVCNINKVHRPAAEPIIQMLLEMGMNRTRVMKFFSHLSKLVSPEFIDDTFIPILKTLELANYTTERLMFEVQRPCSELFINCMWLGVEMPCEKLIRVSTSAEGFCCSFNYKPPLDPAKLDLDRDFIDNTNPEIYRGSGAGPSAGLEAIIDVSKADYYSYSQIFYGVSVYVHAFDSFPQRADKVFVAQPATEALIAVKPTVHGSSNNIRALPLAVRKCFFADERRLRTTNKYTFQACISECAVNITFRMCKCVPFYYPEVHIFDSQQPDNLNVTVGLRCDLCLPSCSEETYKVSAISSSSSSKLRAMEPRFINLKVFYKELSCIKYQRDIFMTWDTMFASIGGIFSLCLGGSLISLVEFLYYFTFNLLKNFTCKRSAITKVKPNQRARRKQLQ